MTAEHDYRDSHLDKGAVYDSDLEQAPVDNYMAAREQELLSTIVPRLFPAGVPRYLDFACGTGRITQQVENLARESVGVDVSASMMQEAQRKCQKTQFLLGDLTQQQMEIPPVDLVTAFRFFGNAQDELRVAALHAIHRVLKKGGYLILNNHCNQGSLHNRLMRVRGHVTRLDLDYGALKKLLREYNFRVLERYGVGGWLVRYKFYDHVHTDNRRARWLEKISQLPFLAPLCPDIVIVAQRQ